jgi:hypothetical protein
MQVDASAKNYGKCYSPLKWWYGWCEKAGKGLSGAVNTRHPKRSGDGTVTTAAED